MIGPFFATGFGPSIRETANTQPSAPRQDLGVSMRIRELTEEIQRMRLLNQALWELLRDRAGFTDADFEAKIKEVDLRDGVEDGRMTDTAVECPRCHRVSNSKHGMCLYCGTKFKQPIMR